MCKTYISFTFIYTHSFEKNNKYNSLNRIKGESLETFQ